MPKGDRTGPEGKGSRTGRDAGYCAGFSMPGYAHPQGRRFSRARGPFLGRGWRHHHWYHAVCHPGWMGYCDTGLPGWEDPDMVYYPPELEPDEEREVLKAQADHLKQHLDEIEKRMAELKKTGEKK